ncbi:DUF4864 domain-containing protein [Lichenihabitans sp. Uapishka_5]|uniref:DUF4864 domain-containing protein n=1 Tax=Lichenihabitans sp. Uapishka_5 TaxID=3037302 RepID=UPI0029E827E1|nr:DUF4864 domain-containing protein [Lichenihabitans sp. Uapishka_5]MDX7951186.1 DUF4864 domain-containing protein [Lichenihabitans sp. Uapishka_5]
MRAVVLASVMLCVTLNVAARADDSPADQASQTAIQGVISQQLQAFRSGDGSTAESFASPGIRDKFPDPAGFMAMVRQAYGALVNPKSTRFGELTKTELGLVQKMTVVDAKGAVWTVAYTMTQVDGEWRISGCFVLKSDAVDA